MKSAYKKRFWLRLAEAVRAGWASLIVAALLLYVPSIKKQMSVPVLAPLLSILVAGPPFGTVLQNSVGIVTVTLPALASTIAVLQWLSPPISRIAAIACTGISSYVITYLSGTHLLGRKVALAQISIVYITAHYDPDTNVVFFPLKILVPNVLGLGVAIVATLIPVPRLALREMRESAKSAARGESEVFKTLTRAFSAADASFFSAMNLHSKILAKAAKDSIAVLKSKQKDIWWEFGAFGARQANKRFTNGLDCLNLHLEGMEMALDSGNVLHGTEPLRIRLDGTLTRVSDHCKSLLEIAVKVLPRFSGIAAADQMRRQELLEEAKDILILFDQDWLSARQATFYSTEAQTTVNVAESSAQEKWEEGRTNSGTADLSRIRWKFRGRVSSLFFLFNLRLYFVEAVNLVSASHRMATKMHEFARIGPSVASLELSIINGNAFSQQESHGEEKPRVFLSSGDDLSQQERRAPSERLRRDKPAVFLSSGDELSQHGRRVSSEYLRRDSSSHRGVQSKEEESASTVDPSQHGNSKLYSGASRLCRDSSPSAIFNEEALRSIPATEISQHGNRPTPSGSLRSEATLHRQCSHRHAVAMENIINTVGGNDSKRWKLLKRLGVAPTKVQTKRSFKTALSMTLATIFGTLILQGKAQAFWAPVTVAFIIGNFQGGSWRISSLRLQGTVLGSIYGYLALNASHNHRWAILLLLIPWVIFSSFIRYSPSYGYMGLVSAFTAAILMLGGFQYDIKQFAMDRITETFVGIFCFIIVETVVFPERAVILVREELVSSLIHLRDCVAVIVSVYTEQQCTHCRSLAVKEIKVLERELRASFAKQPVLSKEAALEPDLWFVPFPEDVYSKLIAIQGRMLDLLFFMVCSLHATTEDCLSEQLEKLLSPLRASLTAMQDEVLSTIDCLQHILQVKVVQDGTWGRLKRRAAGYMSSTSDAEQSQSRHPQHPLLTLGHKHRSVDGIPLNLKATMASFEHSFEEVLEGIIASTKDDPEHRKIFSNSVMSSVASLTFSLYSLLRETVHLEKGVHELLQAESPWSALDFWARFPVPGPRSNPPSQTAPDLSHSVGPTNI